MPTTVVVQLVAPCDQRRASSARRRHRRRCPGRRSVGDSAAASAIGQRRRRPEPAPDPGASVVLPGETISRLLPSALICAADLRLGALAEPDGQHHRGDADQDAEHGQRRPQPVRADRVPDRCGRSRPSSSPARPPAVVGTATRPSRIRTIRRARVGDVGLVGDQHDRAARARAARRTARGRRRSTVESRLPVGSSARISAGSVTSARATATRCCCPPDSSPGRCSTRSPRPDPLQGRHARAPCARRGRRRRSISGSSTLRHADSAAAG